MTAPTPRFEIGESSTAAAARQAERPMSRENDVIGNLYSPRPGGGDFATSEEVMFDCAAHILVLVDYISLKYSDTETTELARTNDPEDDDSSA
ncbi:hypothetical protein Tco_0762553 [Tanacetum coccineum]